MKKKLAAQDVVKSMCPAASLQLEMEKRLYCAGAEFHGKLQSERERLSKCRQLFTRTADVLSHLNSFEKYQLLLNVQHYKDELRTRGKKLQGRDIRVLIAGEYGVRNMWGIPK